MASAAGLEEVLEVVIPHITDLRTLCVCSRLSTHFEAATSSTVQLCLPALLAAAPSDAGMLSAYAEGRGPLPWLCRVAGPDRVSTLEAGCAILRVATCTRQTDRQGASIIAVSGLRVSNEMLVCMAKQRATRLGDVLASWLSDFPQAERSQLDKLYLEAATRGAHGRRSYHPSNFETLVLSLVTAANLPDVLLLLVNQATFTGCYEVEQLLQHDKEHLHVLHTPPSSSDSKEGGSSTSGQPRDQQWQDEFVTHLLETCVLYDMDSVFSAVAALPAAQSLSAAAVTQLLYLAWLRVDQHGWFKRDSKPDAVTVKAITSLPAAQGVSADCISTLVSRSFELLEVESDRDSDGPRRADQEQIEAAMPLLQLPGAKCMDSQWLCECIDKAGRGQLRNVVGKLCRLAAGRQLDPDALVWLFRSFLDKSWAAYRGIEYFHDHLELLEPMEPGRQLTGDTLLELMEHCAASDDLYYNLGDLCYLKPAADRIDDLQRFLAMIHKALQRRVESDEVSDLLSRLPVAQRMQLSDWVTVMTSMLQQRHSIPADCEKLPVVQGMDVDTLGQLLQLAAARQAHDAVVALCSLPAAKQLSLSLITEVVLQMLPRIDQASAEQDSADDGSASSTDWDRYWARTGEAVSSIMKPGLLQQLPSAALHQLLDTLVDRGLLAAAEEIHDNCPQPEEWQPQLSMERWLDMLIQACGRGDVVAANRLVGRLRVQDLTPQQVEPLLVLCMQQYSKQDFFSNVFADLLELPAAQQLDAAALMRLLASTEQVAECRQWFFASLLGLPAADLLEALAVAPPVMSCLRSAEDNFSMDLLGLPIVRDGIDAGSVAELLEVAVDKCDASGVTVLLGLPETQQLSDEQLRSLVFLAVRCGDWGVRERFLELPVVRGLGAEVVLEMLQIGVDEEDSTLVSTLLALPGAGAINASAATSLLQSCIKQSTRTHTLDSLLRGLPAVQQLSAQQLSSLAFLSVRLNAAQSLKMLMRLPAMKAAAGVNPELQALCGALQKVKQP